MVRAPDVPPKVRRQALATRRLATVSPRAGAVAPSSEPTIVLYVPFKDAGCELDERVASVLQVGDGIEIVFVDEGATQDQTSRLPLSSDPIALSCGSLRESASAASLSMLPTMGQMTSSGFWVPAVA